MTEDEKYIICDWKYSDEYAIYNNTPYEEDLAEQRGFAHPDFTGYTFYDGEQLIGFTSLYPEESAVMVGIGAAPEHCDKGYGKLMLRITCRLSKSSSPESSCIWKYAHGTSVPFNVIIEPDSVLMASPSRRLRELVRASFTGWLKIDIKQIENAEHCANPNTPDAIKRSVHEGGIKHGHTRNHNSRF